MLFVRSFNRDGQGGGGRAGTTSNGLAKSSSLTSEAGGFQRSHCAELGLTKRILSQRRTQQLETDLSKDNEKKNVVVFCLSHSRSGIFSIWSKHGDWLDDVSIQFLSSTLAFPKTRANEREEGGKARQSLVCCRCLLMTYGGY